MRPRVLKSQTPEFRTFLAAILARRGGDSTVIDAAVSKIIADVYLGVQGDQPFTAGAAAPQPHHLGAGGSFVDEHQSGRIEHELFSPPASACEGHVRPLLLRGVQAFF